MRADTDFRSDVGDRPARVSHQLHRLGPELRGELLRLSDMKTSSLRDLGSRE